MVVEGIGLRKPSDGLKRQKSTSNISGRPTDTHIIRKSQNQKAKAVKKTVSEETVEASSPVAKATNLEDMQKKLAGIALSTDSIEPADLPRFRLPKYKKSKSRKWNSNLSRSIDFNKGLLVHEEMKMRVDYLQKLQDTAENTNKMQGAAENTNNNNQGLEECQLGGYSVNVYQGSYGPAWPKREVGVHVKIPHVGKYQIKQPRAPHTTLAEYRKQLRKKKVKLKLHHQMSYIENSV